MRFIFSVLVFILSGQVCFAAFEFRETGARAAGFSGAYSAMASDVTAPFWNPGALGVLKSPQAALNHTRFFSLESLSASNFSIVAPSRLGGVGIGLNQFGTKDYQERELIFSHGFKIFPRVSAGYSLKGLLLKIQDFGSSAKLGMDTGFHVQVTKRLDVAVTGRNINHPTFGKNSEAISSIWTSGLAFKVMPGLTSTFDLEGLGSASARIKTGMELRLSPSFSLLGGLESRPSRFSGGFRISRSGLALDYAYRHHPFLSGTHNMGLSFSWNRPKKVEKAMVFKPTLPKPNPKINLRTATEEELIRIRGIGKFTAEKILSYREKHGIHTFDDLLNIPGLTKRVFFSLKEQTVLESP